MRHLFWPMTSLVCQAIGKTVRTCADLILMMADSELSSPQRFHFATCSKWWMKSCHSDVFPSNTWGPMGPCDSITGSLKTGRRLISTGVSRMFTVLWLSIRSGNCVQSGFQQSWKTEWASALSPRLSRCKQNWKAGAIQAYDAHARNKCYKAFDWLS